MAYIPPAIAGGNKRGVTADEYQGHRPEGSGVDNSDKRLIFIKDSRGAPTGLKSARAKQFKAVSFLFCKDTETPAKIPNRFQESCSLEIYWDKCTKMRFRDNLAQPIDSLTMK